MEKYVTNIKDLVIQVLTNGSKIKAKAEKNDALACFQMSMIYLLGIDTPIDFKKACKYLKNQSLSDDPNANRLLGFIEECEGNYSLAFKNYSKVAGTTGGKAKKPYINKVYTERNNLLSYLKKLELPSNVLNKEITIVLNEYIEGGDNKVNASIKLAMICDNQDTYLTAAQTLFEVGDYFSAKRWLQNGGINSKNPLYSIIDKKLIESKVAFNLSDSMQVIDITGNSLLFEDNTLPSIEEIKQLCSNASLSSKRMWHKNITELIEPIIKEEKENLENQTKTKLAEEELVKEQNKKIKDKVETYSGFISIIVLAISGYYLYTNYSIFMATIVIVVILAICGMAINYVEQKLGLESDDDK